jgi:hypothetical protein
LLILTAMAYSAPNQQISSVQHRVPQADTTNEEPSQNEKPAEQGEPNESTSGFTTFALHVYDGGLHRTLSRSTFLSAGSTLSAPLERNSIATGDGFSLILQHAISREDRHAYLVCRYPNPPPSLT